jgi:hypothetical protein
MKTFSAVAGVTALLVAGGASPTSETVRSETVAARPVAMATLPGLGRFTAACRRGSATVTFRAAANAATETVAVGGRSLLLDPGRRLAVRLRGVTVWQIAAISEGGIVVGDATMSAARMADGTQCFVTVRADVARRAR